MGNNASENAEHIVVAQYLQAMPWVLWMHPANGGYRLPSTARLLRRLGVSPGVPDILIFTPGPLSGKPLAIEMKSESKTAYVTPVQRVWLKRLHDVGWDTHVCRGATQALGVLRAAGFASLRQTPAPARTAGETAPSERPVAVSIPVAGMVRNGGSPGPVGLACS